MDGTVSNFWESLLRELPGYNPFLQSRDCWFRADVAETVIEYIQAEIVHAEGELAGKPFTLSRWQQAYFANLFGWARKDGVGRTTRRYRESLLYVPRKNGKTPMIAALGLMVLDIDDEFGQQDYISAASAEQAAKLFNHAKVMVEMNERLAQKFRIFGGPSGTGHVKSIFDRRTNSALQVISGKPRGKHGQVPHLVIMDELHEQPNRVLYDTLQTGFASMNRRQPLFISMTTFGESTTGIWYEVYQRAKRVVANDGDPAQPGYDPAFLPALYELPLEEDGKPVDWRDPKNWERSNPNYGVSVNPEYLAGEVRKIDENPALESRFRRWHLNQPVRGATRWLSVSDWDACPKLDLAALKGKSPIAGLDLASTDDLVALVLVWRVDGLFHIKPHFWATTKKIHQRSATGIPYPLWVQHGWLRECPGDWIDYDQVFQESVVLMKEHRCTKVVYDPAQASMMAQAFQGKNYALVRFGQTHKNYNEACKLLGMFLADKKVPKIVHDGNPVMRWCVENVVLDQQKKRIQTEEGGKLVESEVSYCMPSKGASAEKIDGVVGALMAIAEWILSPELSKPKLSFF